MEKSPAISALLLASNSPIIVVLPVISNVPPTIVLPVVCIVSPTKLDCNVPKVIFKSPVEDAVPVVVPKINLSDDSSQPINALLPALPLSINIPLSF